MHNIKGTSLLKYGLIIVVLCFAVSVIMYMQFSIDGIVFLEHYYDVEIYESKYLELHFISNTYDNRDIWGIRFPQLPEGFAYIELDYVRNRNNDGIFRKEKFAHYNYNVISFIIHVPKQNDGLEESVILDKAIIEFSNGEEQEVNLGKIIFNKNSINSASFVTTFSSSSNNHSSASGMKAKKDAVIENIVSGLDDETKGILDLKLNGNPEDDLQYPLHIIKDDSLTFNSQYKFEPEDIRKYNVYDIQKKIVVRDEGGNISSGRILNMDYGPAGLFRSEKGISRYLKLRGVK